MPSRRVSRPQELGAEWGGAASENQGGTSWLSHPRGPSAPQEQLQPQLATSRLSPTPVPDSRPSHPRVPVLSPLCRQSRQG